MERSRMEAFSDGVLAIIITIMVLNLKMPAGSGFPDLLPVLPQLGSYAMSFAYIGAYWSNHHHTVHAVTNVNGNSCGRICSFYSVSPCCPLSPTGSG